MMGQVPLLRQTIHGRKRAANRPTSKLHGWPPADAGAYEALKAVSRVPKRAPANPWRPSMPNCCATTKASHCNCGAPRRWSISKKAASLLGLEIDSRETL